MKYFAYARARLWFYFNVDVIIGEGTDKQLLSNVMRSGVTGLVNSLSHQLAGENIRANNIILDRMTHSLF